MTPISSRERIEILDVLRGLALFGIITANMRAFNSPQAAYFDHSLMWQGVGDRIAQGFIDLFVTGKFVTLFSLLFGIGFAVQMERADARGVASRLFYVRRLIVLLIIGLAHGFLLWWGDILAPYALMGGLLLLFRKRSQGTILIWAVIFYAWPMMLMGAAMAAHSAGVAIPKPPHPTPEELQRVIQIFANGTYAEMLRVRVKEMAFNGIALVFFYPRVLGLFLFGLWVWRAGIIRNLAQYEPVLRRCRNWGLVVGLVGNAAVLAMFEIWRPNPTEFTREGFVVGIAGSIAIPALSLFYASSVILLSREETWRRVLHPFGAIGRTALSNYLLQSVICTTLYNSWGFGLFGKVGPLAGLIPTILIYSAQVPLSSWWTARFSFGPMEWIWRTLTYGRLQALSRPAAVQTS
jgi:uncharacterized protein